MLISMLGTLVLTRVWVNRLHTLVRVPCGVNMFALLQNPVICMDDFYLINLISRDSASYFIGMIMLISEIGTLTKEK